MPGKRVGSWKRIVLLVIGILVVLFAVMQVVPYGRSHTNPPAVNEFKWTGSQAEALAQKACHDCHSNHTNWWWATNIAPFSWLVQADVDRGRRRFNFSEYTGVPSLRAFQETVQGRMPPLQYIIMHPNAKLSDAEKQMLINGYGDSIAANSGVSSGGASGSSVAGTGDTVTPDTANTDTVTTAAVTTDAVAVINQACSDCHSAAPALRYHASSPGQAKALINNMINQGAALTVAEQMLLLQYYTR